MSEDSKHWDQLIEKLTAGEAVDWDCEVQKEPFESDYLNQLKVIENIYKVLNPDDRQDEQVLNSDQPYEFCWGHLRVIEKIGEGSFGEVYRAFDPLLNRDVALKLLKSQQVASYKARSFIKEARNLARVRNRHVLAIHGVSMHESRVGLWTDLLDGYTLSNDCSYCADDLLAIAYALADALEAVHQSGLIHGDVKTSNVMSGPNGLYTLMDFGAGGQVDMTSHAIGSPIMMAPELFVEQPKSRASDIYALGALLFKLATGYYPIKANNLLEVMQAHRDQAYLSLQQLRPDLNKSLLQMINLMLSIAPELRPTATAIKTNIEDIRTAPQRRNKRLVLWVIFTVLVLGTVLSSLGFYQATQARKTAEVEQQKATAASNFLHEMLESPREFGDGQEMKVVKLLDYSAKNAAIELADQPAVLASIEHALGSSYSALFLYSRALEHIEKSIALKNKLYAADHQLVLDDLFDKSFALAGMDKFQQSNEVAEQVIALTLANPAVLKTNLQEAYRRMGHNYMALDEPEKALFYLEHELIEIEAPEKAMKNTSAQILEIKSAVYFGLGEHEKAERLAREALAWYQAWGSTDKNKHRTVNLMPVRNQLANALSIQGKLVEAEMQYRAALDQAESYYGPENKGYLVALINLAIGISRQGKYIEALAYQQQAMELSLKLYGKKHEYTIKAGINLANTKVSMGDLAGGELVMRDTLVNAVALAGEDSMNALMLAYNLAELLGTQGKYKESELLSESNYKKMQQTLGDKHPFTPLALSNLATALAGQSRFTEAAPLHQKAVFAIEEKMGAKHPFYFVVAWNRINFYHLKDQKDPGINELIQLIASQTEVLGAEHAETLRSQKLLAKWQ